ncbi:MAG: hypothetical protein ABL867_00110 [Rickettsiales bacterium]
MHDLARLELSPSKNPLLYLEYEGQKLRVVIDRFGKPWAVIGDLCAILELTEPSAILRRITLRPYLSQAVLESLSGMYHLPLINRAGIDIVLEMFGFSNRQRFKDWLDHAFNHISTLGRIEPPTLDLDLEG